MNTARIMAESRNTRINIPLQSDRSIAIPHIKFNINLRRRSTEIGHTRYRFIGGAVATAQPL